MGADEREVDWGFLFHGDRRPVLGSSEPVPGGDLLGIDGLVMRYRAAYPEGDSRRNWIEERLRKWFSQRKVE